MKKKKSKKYKVLLTISIILIILIIGYLAYKQFLKWWYKESQIAVRVGDDIITYEEINNRILLSVGTEGLYDPVYQERYLTIRKQITDEIIQDSLIMKYAKEKGYTVKEEELDFESYLGNDKYRIYFVELIKKEIQNEIKKSLSNEVLIKYFNENKIEFILLKAQVIFIESKSSDTDRNIKKQKIEEAYNKYLAGYSFKSLVRDYSDIKDNDGITDYFDIFKYSAPINEIIFNMKIGEVSKPISTIDGFYIFKILDRIDSFEKVKNKVEERYLNLETSKKLAQLKEKLMEENKDIIIYGNRTEKLKDWYNKVLLGRGG
ncbi:MAG: peptidylprolyl isomerase [Caldisericia bacterium]